MPTSHASGIQHPVSGIQNPASGIQNPASGIRHLVSNFTNKYTVPSYSFRGALAGVNKRRIIMINEGQTERDVTPDYIRRFLKEPPMLLRNFHYEDIMEFLNLGIEERFVKDDVIVNESEFVNSAYLIAEGKVAIWKGNIQLAVLNDGNFLGETFLFSKNNRMAKVISEGESTLLRYERYDALNFFRKKPEKLFNIFTRNIIEIQQKKISNMNVQLLQLKKRLLNDSGW